MNHYTGIHHAAFATKNIELTVRYWRDLLKMPLIYSYGQPGSRQYFFRIGTSCKISFFEWPNVEKIPLKRHGDPVNGPFAFDHISIGVDHEEALWELLATLEGADFPVSDVVNHGYFYSLYSYDPNGIPVEFSWDRPGSGDRLRHSEPHRDHGPESDIASEPLEDQWPAPFPILPEERIIVDGEGSENGEKIGDGTTEPTALMAEV
ncbi:MAG: VOC family protein [Magnetococcales bacterium]|nr:VOC family protein [Magnetococcales bacterium]